MKRQLIMILVLIAAQALLIGGPDAPRASAQKTPGPAGTVEKRRRLVCLPEEMHRFYQADLPTDHAHILGLKTAEGEYLTLLRTKLSEALFADEQLRSRELVLSGKIYPQSRIFDVTRMRSIKNGKVHLLFYYCDVCAVESVIPGPCVCCRDPVYLVEKPVE